MLSENNEHQTKYWNSNSSSEKKNGNIQISHDQNRQAQLDHSIRLHVFYPRSTWPCLPLSGFPSSPRASVWRLELLELNQVSYGICSCLGRKRNRFLPCQFHSGCIQRSRCGCRQRPWKRRPRTAHFHEGKGRLCS